MKHEYAREKLMLLLRDLDRYNGDEFWREMSRIAHGATDHPSAEDLLKERDALARFANDMVTEIFEHPGSDIDGKLAEDCLLEAGIIFAAPYEPNGKHSQAPVEDVEEGEDLLECCQWFLKAVDAAKAKS